MKNLIIILLFINASPLISQKHFTVEDAKIYIELNKQDSIRSLSISCWNCSIDSLRNYLNIISKLKQLELLSIYCDIELPAAYIHFPKESRVQNIEIICLKFENIGRTIENLSALKNLRKLLIRGNENELPKEITKLKSLEKLDISQNNFRIIPRYLNQLTQLKELDLSYNNITTINFSLGELPYIKKINISHNSLNDEKQNKLFINRDTSLEILIFKHNNLTNIPCSIQNLKNLRVIEVADSNLNLMPKCIHEMNVYQWFIGTNKMINFPKNIPLIIVFEEFSLPKFNEDFIQNSHQYPNISIYGVDDYKTMSEEYQNILNGKH